MLQGTLERVRKEPQAGSSPTPETRGACNSPRAALLLLNTTVSLNRILQINPRDPPSRGNKTSSKSRLLAKVWAKGESYFG